MKEPIGSAESQEKIFKVALPVSLEAVFQTSLGFVDQIIVGTLGGIAVAAVGLCNSVSFIVMLLYSAIGTGAGVLVAQAFGRNDLNDVSKVASLSLVLSGIFGVSTTLPLVLYPGPVLRLIGAPVVASYSSTGEGFPTLPTLPKTMSFLPDSASP